MAQIGASNKLLLSEREVADVFGFPARTLQQWRFLGTGPKFVKAGRRVFYRTIDLEEFISTRIRTSTKIT